MTADLILIQLFAGWQFYQYFAHGNLLMIFSVFFTLTQWVSMYLLLWNDEFYLYDFRLVRYMVLLAAMVFNFIYACWVSAELEIVWVEGTIYKEDNAVEVILALVLGELIIYYFPTFLVNLFIILKEMTLNQLAWRKVDDYREGQFFNWINMDILYWLGFDQNIYEHLMWLAAWSHEFL